MPARTLSGYPYLGDSMSLTWISRDMAKHALDPTYQVHPDLVRRQRHVQLKRTPATLPNRSFVVSLPGNFQLCSVIVSPWTPAPSRKRQVRTMGDGSSEDADLHIEESIAGSVMKRRRGP